MPASTFNIIAPNWKSIEELMNNIKDVCTQMNFFCFQENEDTLIVKNNRDADNQLTLELYSQLTVDWYYEEYPLAMKEPETRVPYYYYLEEFGERRFYLIASANNYLDYELTLLFSKKYLSLNQEHFVSLNGERCMNYQQLKSIENNDDFWFERSDGYFKVSNYNV